MGRQSTCKESAPVFELYERAFTKPGSTTYRTPGTVIEVSAMLVASMTCSSPCSFLSGECSMAVAQYICRIKAGIKGGA